MASGRLSIRELDDIIDYVEDAYWHEVGSKVMAPGQIRYTCVSAKERAGRHLDRMKLVDATLTLLHDSDRKVRRESGAEAMRRHRIIRVTDEAKSQGGLLTQEDLANMLCCDARTVRRDIRALKDNGVHVPTRGQQKDIGPGQQHRRAAIQYWIDGCTPKEITKIIKHSLGNVQRYLAAFAEVVSLWEDGHKAREILTMSEQSSAAIRLNLELYNRHKRSSAFRQRREEIDEMSKAM
jgi:transposase